MRQLLYRYACEQCQDEVISEHPPTGWLRVLSKDPKGSLAHHRLPPALWTPGASMEFPEDGYWCSSRCLTAWLEAVAEKLTAKAAKRPHG